MTKRSRSPPPAAAGEGSGKMAARKWVGWEEEVVLDDKERRVVCYYLRCAPPRDADGEVERDIVVVGKLWGVGNMVYSAHPQFLRSIEAAAARSQAPSRAVAVAVEATQLRWKSRREVMDWLTSLVADPPYENSTSADASDVCSLIDHDGGSTATKDAASPIVGNNSEGFAWLGPLPHLDRRRKHYRSFCRDGMRISIYDFIYIKSEERTESNVAYVEDMYEDGNGNSMVLARWLDKPDDDHGVEMPPDVHDREVFFSYGLQDIGVQWVEGQAPVLNYQHFEWFQRREEEHSQWKPYLCHRQIVGETLEPFDIAQLQGYANQDIVRALFKAPSTMAASAKAPNKDITDRGQKRKHDETSEDKTVENPAAPGNVTNGRVVETHSALIVIGDDTAHNPLPCNATDDQTVADHPPQNVAINDQTLQKLPPFNATDGQTATDQAPQNAAISDQTVQKLNPSNDQTGKNNVPVNAPKTETLENKTQALVKLHPSGGSAFGPGLRGGVIKYNADDLFNVGSRIEALSQDSSIRGCWFRCVIVKRKRKLGIIKVKYHDIRNIKGKGHLKEWLRLRRTAEPDRLGIRLTGRPMIRPWPSNSAKIPSPVTAGTIVDVWFHDGWWEGIVVKPTTPGHVRVYFPGEKKIGNFSEGDLRRSFEWIGDKWLTLMARADILHRVQHPDVLRNQVGPKQAPSLVSCMGSARHAKPAGQQIILQRIKGEQSAKRLPPIVILESSQKAEGASTELAAPRPRLQSRENVEDEPPAKPAPQKTILHCSSEGLRLQSSKKGPDEPAAQKLILQYCEEGDFTDGVPPDGKLPRVDLTDFLKSDKVLKWAERKARGSGPLMGYSDGSSQEGVADSAPVNSGPVREECKVNEQASVSTTPLMIGLTDV